MASKVVRWTAICFFVASILSMSENVYVNGETFTTSNLYDSAGRNYDIDGLFCTTFDSNQPLEWRKEYLWAAYCDQEGKAMGSSLCGACIQVKNDSTGEKVTVRILDQCQNGGLVLETDAFNAIDGDGKGKNDGYLLTTYKFVDC